MADPICKVCFRRIANPSDAVVLSAFGRKLVLVHREVCADKAKGFAHSTLRRVGLELSHRLDEKYPMAMGFAREIVEHVRLRRNIT